MVECHQFTGGKFDLLIGQMDANLTLQRMDRDSGIGMVLLHLRVGLHENQDNPEVWILGERLGTTSGFSLPRVLTPELPEFLRQIESQEWVG